MRRRLSLRLYGLYVSLYVRAWTYTYASLIDLVALVTIFDSLRDASQIENANNVKNWDVGHTAHI